MAAPRNTLRQKAANLAAHASRIWNYWSKGVWSDPRDKIGIRIIKTINLSVHSFLDRGLQLRAMSLTYSTVLAIVPAFALIVAIGRGFGLQNLIVDEIFSLFPAQRKVVDTVLNFVNSYLEQSSQGIVIGIGIVFLLWTLISLLSNIEDAFNSIWDIKRQRSLIQKMTDYIAICLLVPVLLICSSGISLFVSTTLLEGLHLRLLTPVVNGLLEASPVLLAWLAFSFSFFLIPNCKVSFRYAAISGLICAVAFQIVQLLFLNGQIYVAKYNTIYGSLAFLPLLLIWLDLSWLILLFGCALTYSLQNVFAYNYEGNISDISSLYRRKFTITVMAIIIHRKIKGMKPLSLTELSIAYRLPIRLVTRSVEELHQAGMVYYVIGTHDNIAIAPAVESDTFTLAQLMQRLDKEGQSDFIPGFAANFGPALGEIESIMNEIFSSMPHILVRDLPVPTPNDISAPASVPHSDKLSTRKNNP